MQGIHVPTLVMSGTCAPHLTLLEIAFDLSAATGKEMVGLEGANHGMMPCDPKYGDTFDRAFAYAGAFLTGVLAGWQSQSERPSPCRLISAACFPATPSALARGYALRMNTNF